MLVTNILETLENELKEINEEDYEFYFERFQKGYRNVNDGLHVIQQNLFKSKNYTSIFKRVVYNTIGLLLTSTLNSILDNVVESKNSSDVEVNDLLERLTNIHLEDKTVDDLINESEEDVYENRADKYDADYTAINTWFGDYSSADKQETWFYNDNDEEGSITTVINNSSNLVVFETSDNIDQTQEETTRDLLEEEGVTEREDDNEIYHLEEEVINTETGNGNEIFYHIEEEVLEAEKVTETRDGNEIFYQLLRELPFTNEYDYAE